MQTTVAQKFRGAIANFARSQVGTGKFSPELRAKLFIEQEDRLCRLFLFVETERLFRLEERAIERESEGVARREDPQLKLLGPGFAELFVGLRQRLPLKAGKVRFEQMTVTQLRESAVVLRAGAKTRAEVRRERQAAFLEGIADAMSPYAQTHRKLSVGDYLELRAAGITVKTREAAGRP